MFITFEGIDCSGKTTQVKLLKDYLSDRGNKVEVLREPGGTVISEKIRKVLLDKKNFKMSNEVEILLFSASRSQLVWEVIRPMLAEGYYILLDRFFDSTTAYQGYGRGIPLEAVQVINRLAVGDTIPDITFYLDVPQEEAARRKREVMKTAPDRIESSDDVFYNKVRQGYLAIAAAEPRFQVLDGCHTIEQLHAEIIARILKFEQGTR